MGFYRIYCLDKVSRFVTAEEIEAGTDAEAIRIASEMHNGLRREIWQRDRHIANIEIDQARQQK